jgi:type II secretory pathway pseudopilin PulG
MNKGIRRGGEAGYTMIEMTLVMLIITTLALVVMPKMAGALQRAKEGSATANLTVMRTALYSYSSDQGTFPTNLAALNGQYVSAIPAAKGLSHHADSNAVTFESEPSDAGGWSYDNNPNDANFGQIVINCTHTDERGNLWASY